MEYNRACDYYMRNVFLPILEPTYYELDDTILNNYYESEFVIGIDKKVASKLKIVQNFKDYTSIPHKQYELNDKIARVKKSIFDVSDKLFLDFEIKYMAVHLFEYFFSTTPGIFSEVSLTFLVIVVMAISIKFIGRNIHLNNEGIIELLYESLDKENKIHEIKTFKIINALEGFVLNRTQFKLLYVTEREFLLAFVIKLNKTYGSNFISSEDIISSSFLCDCCLLEHNYIEAKPSLIASTCLYFSKYYNTDINKEELSKTWDEKIMNVTGYNSNQIINDQLLHKIELLYKKYNKNSEIYENYKKMYQYIKETKI